MSFEVRLPNPTSLVSPQQDDLPKPDARQVALLREEPPRYPAGAQSKHCLPAGLWTCSHELMLPDSEDLVILQQEGGSEAP